MLKSIKCKIEQHLFWVWIEEGSNPLFAISFLFFVSNVSFLFVLSSSCGMQFRFAFSNSFFSSKMIVSKKFHSIRFDPFSIGRYIRKKVWVNSTRKNFHIQNSREMKWLDRNWFQPIIKCIIWEKKFLIFLFLLLIFFVGFAVNDLFTKPNQKWQKNKSIQMCITNCTSMNGYLTFKLRSKVLLSICGKEN